MNFIKLIEAIKVNIEEKIGREIDKKVIYPSLLFTIASVIGLKRLKVENNFINVLSILFAPSGAGKDTALKVIEDNLEVLELYPDILVDRFSQDIENYIIPSNYKVPLMGTIQGAMLVGNFIQSLKVGSLNIQESEFGSVMNKQIMEFLIKLWQSGESLGSINVNERYAPIKNLPTNALLFGTLSPFERDDKKYADLIEVLETGFARRALFFNIKINKISSISHKNVPNLKELLSDIVLHIKSIKKQNIAISDNAKYILEEYRNKLIDIFNKEPTDWNMIRTSNIDKIIRVAGIIAMINLHDKVEKEDIKIAIELSEISDNDLFSIIKPKQPYLKMFEHLKIVKSKFKTELLDKLGIKMNKSQLNEQLEMLKEYAYRHNYELKITDMMVHLMPLKESSLDEIIVSINTEGLKEKGVNAKNRLLKFFGNEMTIEQLVKSNVDWFSFVHYNGTRSQKNAIPEFNAIAFDIDDLLSLDDALALLFPYTYLIYTTKSHQKEKNGIVADRYRIVLPLKRIISLDASRYKEFIKNIASLLNIKQAIDYSTVEISRLWFPNSEAKIYKNVADILDPICCIPETKTQKEVSRTINNVTGSATDKRLQGIINWAVSNAIVGSRNTVLFRAGMLIKDVFGSEIAKEKVLEINNYLSEPISEKEIEKTIFRRL